MYPPIRKDFRDVEYSLELLKVASQIEFHALMQGWHGLLTAHLEGEVNPEATKATRDLFLTLPFEDQVDLLEMHESSFIDFIDASSLATLVKKNCTANGHNWPVIEGNSRQEQASSNRVGNEAVDAIRKSVKHRLEP